MSYSYDTACHNFRAYFLLYDQDVERFISKDMTGTYRQLRSFANGEYLFSTKLGFATVISRCKPTSTTSYASMIEMKILFEGFIMSVELSD